MRGFIVGKPRLNQMMLAVLGAGIAVSAAGPGASAAGGDPSAKAEVIAAFTRLNALPGYRIKVAGHDSAGVVTATGVLEVVPPDKVHGTVRYSPQSGVEFFYVGKENRIQFTMPGQPGGWQCSSSENRPLLIFDVEKMRKERAAVIRKPDTVIDGTPVHVYVDAANPRDMLFIGTKTGLPRRFVDGDRESGGAGDFYDYGAKIAITLPPCN